MLENTHKTTILILGGYGVFGGRLVHLLSDCADLNLIITGRNLAKAEAFCSAQTGQVDCQPYQLDRKNIRQAIIAISPDVIVDATGPFQNYGDDPYDVIRAAIESKINYLDFADGSNFVAGVQQFDQAAIDSGVFILSGVSSFPVLTAAVVRHLGKGVKVEKITGGIAPSPFAGIGLNVMRAVVGYAGSPVKLMCSGKATHRPGLTESRNYTIAPPGRLPLRNLRFSLVDVPDLQLIPPSYPDLTDIWIGAGPVPEILHRALNLLAKLQARKLLPSLVPLSGFFYKVLNLMKFGEHRGGMFVEIEGLTDGKTVKRSWHLLAEGDDGPLIPSMAIETIIRNIQAGKSPNPGARAALDELELADYENSFSSRTIYTGIRSDVTAKSHIFQHQLDNSFATLPNSVQILHCPQKNERWKGKAQIQRGNNPITRLIATFFRFPKSNETVDVDVEITRHPDNTETWQRTFDGRSFKSHLSAGTGKNHRLIIERFGPVSFGLALVIKDNRLYFVPRNWRFLGISMPKFMTPNGESYEFESDGKFHFSVEIAAPIIGRIVQYRGWLISAN